MATTLAPVDAREVVRCDHCSLVQFRTNNSCCRKCKKSLDPDEPEIVMAESVQPPSPGPAGLQIATTIRNLRLSSGLSQRQLALRMAVPRTYVSKIENDKATPTLSSLARLARALEVSVPDLLTGSSMSHQIEVRELMADEFISEIAPFVFKLDAMQRNTFLSQVRDMTRPRRSA